MKTLHLAIVLFIMLTVLIPQVANAQVGRVFFGSQQPQIITSGNVVSILWDYFNPDDATYLITSSDNGTSFGEKIKINRNNTLEMGFGNPVIDGNNVYRVGAQSSTGTQIYFIKSVDYGITFTKPIVVAGNPNTLQQVEIDKFFTTGNCICIVWSINHFVGNQNVGTIFLSKSTDRGSTFDKPLQISKNDTAWFGLNIVTSQNKTYFVWQTQVDNQCAQDNCKIQVHLRSMENNNMSETLTPLILDNIQQLEISTSGNNVYLTGIAFKTDSLSHVVDGTRAYYANKTAPQWVFFSKSEDGGISFDKTTNLSGSIHHCTMKDNGGVCEIAGVMSYPSGKNVYIVWTAENYTKNAVEAFFISSTDNGNTFDKVMQLKPYGFENIVCQSVDECINVATPQTPKDAVYLAWATNKINQYGDHVIFAKSANAGKSFDYSDVSNVTKITSQPTLSLGSDVIYLAGTRSGFPEGNHEFFAKSTDGGNTFDDGVDLDVQKEVSVPEFSSVVPMLLIGTVLTIVFYRTKSGI